MLERFGETKRLCSISQDTHFSQVQWSLFSHKNSLRIRANPIVHHVGPVMEDDMPVRLSGQSPLRLLDRRLDELELPKHGTKLDKWTRIERTSRRGSENRRWRLNQIGKLDREDVHVKLQSRSPTITEKEVHELTHLPPQPWCEQCVRGRGYGESLQTGDIRTSGIHTSCYRV